MNGVFQMLFICFALLSVTSTAFAAPVVNEWPGGNAPGKSSFVTSAKLSGVWATVNNKKNSVAVCNIRGELVYEVTSSALDALLPDATINGICLTDSGRQLFLALRGDNDCIAAINLNLKVLRIFTQVDLSNSGKPNGMCHYFGNLYVGTDEGILQFDASRNVKSVESSTSTLLETHSGISSIASDSKNKKLYAVTGQGLYEQDMVDTTSTAILLSSDSNLVSATYARTYGGADNGGLYVMSDSGEISFVDQDKKLTSYYESKSKNIATTSCGRMLLSGKKPKILSDDSDTRLSFEDWLVDEFNQYILLNKSLLWPDGEPEGWVLGAAASEGEVRAQPPCGVSAAVSVYMLLVSDDIADEPEAQSNIRSILKRYAGTQPDGIRPARNLDGHNADFVDPETGEGVYESFARPQCYGIMFIMAAAEKAKLIYTDDQEIQEAANIIIGDLKRSADYVEVTGAPYFWADEYGPFPGVAYGPYCETDLFAHIAAAEDPLATHLYADITHRRDDVTGPDGTPLMDTTFLDDEPVLLYWLTVFVHMYDMTILEAKRQGEGWQREFANYYSHFSAWTDDNGPEYMTVFSAGVAPKGYSVDNFASHVDDFVHFPAVLGFSILGDPAPSAGAYMAYREGRRSKMAGKEGVEGADILVRYSAAHPDFKPNRHSPVDFHFGMMGLAELIKPGVMDEVCAGHFYREGVDVSKTEDGRIRLDYSKITPRKVLASKNGKDWVPYGYHVSPYVFDKGEKYKHYKVVDPEGEVLDDVRDVVKQTIDLSKDFNKTKYIIRAYVKNADQDAELQVSWDSAAPIKSNEVNAFKPVTEYILNITKPSNASQLHIELTNCQQVESVVVIRIGAEMLISDGLVDISGDPKGTRYIIKADAHAEDMTGGFANLEVRVQRDALEDFDPKRKLLSNKITESGNTKLIRTLRKREDDEIFMRIMPVMHETDSVAIENIKIHKIDPQPWKY